MSISNASGQYLLITVLEVIPNGVSLSVCVVDLQTCWLLFVAVWIPAFWILLQLPGTCDSSKASAPLDFPKYKLKTIDIRLAMI